MTVAATDYGGRFDALTGSPGCIEYGLPRYLSPYVPPADYTGWVLAC